MTISEEPTIKRVFYVEEGHSILRLERYLVSWLKQIMEERFDECESCMAGGPKAVEERKEEIEDNLFRYTKN